MADVEHQDHDVAILYISDEAIVADAVAPLPAAVRRQPLAVQPRILAALEVLADPPEDQRRRVPIELLQGLFRRRRKKHMIRQESPSSFSTSSSVNVSGCARYSAIARS